MNILIFIVCIHKLDIKLLVLSISEFKFSNKINSRLVFSFNFKFDTVFNKNLI